MKLEKIYEITGIVQLRSGLHIGGNKDTIEIGGMDQPIIKFPVAKGSLFSGQPYIPGSSLKGKMRSMLEISNLAKENGPQIKADGKPCGCGKCVVCTIFGTANDTKPDALGPTRIIVRDATLTEAWRNRFSDGELPMEEKYENTIHRIKGIAEHPRPLERVPAGVEFDLSISLKEFEHDHEKKLLNWLWKGLRLIELDGLGGSISRGSGQVIFENIKVNNQEINWRDQNLFEEK
ncbi:type III-A CRISPR-associated RAMP protein Csm3 [Deltaproteobacteria bacterium TL4]